MIGKLEDSVRHFLTLESLLHKALGGSDGRYAPRPNQPVFFPDWVSTTRAVMAIATCATCVGIWQTWRDILRGGNARKTFQLDFSAILATFLEAGKVS
jgi:hypothetical protein